jgi:MOSC domain-containing protein YiiM
MELESVWNCGDNFRALSFPQNDLDNPTHSNPNRPYLRSHRGRQINTTTYPKPSGRHSILNTALDSNDSIFKPQRLVDCTTHEYAVQFLTQFNSMNPTVQLSHSELESKVVEILHLYISPGHNYFGHHGKPPSRHSMIETQTLHCLADRGIEGDRFLDHKPDYKGQITFFSIETHSDLSESLQESNRDPSTFRRNVVLEGIDLNELINTEFEIAGIRFFGVEECRPCYWMDQAFGPGAETALKGKGGLRARILNSGTLETGRFHISKEAQLSVA